MVAGDPLLLVGVGAVDADALLDTAVMSWSGGEVDEAIASTAQ